MEKLAGEPLTLEQNPRQAEKSRQGSVLRGLWPYPGLRGKVSAGPPVMAGKGGALQAPQPSPSSASYVPADECTAWGAGGGDTNTGVLESRRATCLWERRLVWGTPLTLGSANRQVPAERKPGQGSCGSSV